MKKQKKKAIIIVAIVCVLLLIGAVIADKMLSKSYLEEIKYDKLVEKIEKKDSFILLLSQTECSHCLAFKPKLEQVANEFKIHMYYLETDLLDEDAYAELKKKFSFSGTPTTVFVVNGEETSAATRINGEVSREKIINKLKSNGFIDD